MEKTTVIQGRETTPDDIELVRQLIAANPVWNRKRLSKELCLLWNWRAANGQIKDMACRSFLLKLEQRNLVTLPARQPGGGRKQPVIREIPHKTTPIVCPLQCLKPVQIKPIADRDLLGLFKYFLHRYHYLGFSGTVGENLKYMVFDRENNPLACLLFGSAAWKSASRDEFIGWEPAARKTNLHLLTNNMRFLILPHVKVPHLASHILAHVAKRISADWTEKYGHPILMLETFVEQERFRGTCYKAANWICVGQTKGRSRNDRYNSLKVPIKDMYCYPLTKQFREALANDNA